MRLAASCAVLLLFTAACKKQEAAPEAGASAPGASPAMSGAPSPQAPAAAATGPRADELVLQPLPPMPIPKDNPQTDAKVKLGRELFFDKRLSVDGSRSCYSCHLNEDGTGGHTPIAIGAKEKQLTRHSPVLWNVGYLPKLYWDGRSGSLEEQAMAVWAGGSMGVGKENLEAKAKAIGKIPAYKSQFEAVFPDRGATPETVVQAIAAFERTLVCDDTPFDRYAKGNKTALTPDQKQGLELFMGKAGCVACHTPPYFSIAFMTPEGAYFNTGVGVKDKKEEEVDVGRMSVTKAEADWAAFKPPSLRNAPKSPPYFHDGSQFTLEDAVRFMASGGQKNKNLSPILSDKKLTDAEIQALVKLLDALICPGEIAAPKP